MPLKYQCPKCEKRYIDWGAEKLGFMCPDCEGEKLVQVGLDTLPAAKKKKKKKTAAKAKKKKPALKRKTKAKTKTASDSDGDAPAEDLSDVPEGSTSMDGEDKKATKKKAAKKKAAKKKTKT